MKYPTPQTQHTPTPPMLAYMHKCSTPEHTLLTHEQGLLHWPQLGVPPPKMPPLPKRRLCAENTCAGLTSSMPTASWAHCIILCGIDDRPPLVLNTLDSLIWRNSLQTTDGMLHGARLERPSGDVSGYNACSCSMILCIQLSRASCNKELCFSIVRFIETKHSYTKVVDL